MGREGRDARGKAYQNLQEEVHLGEPSYQKMVPLPPSVHMPHTGNHSLAAFNEDRRVEAIQGKYVHHIQIPASPVGTKGLAFLRTPWAELLNSSCSLVEHQLLLHFIGEEVVPRTKTHQF